MDVYVRERLNSHSKMCFVIPYFFNFVNKKEPSAQLLISEIYLQIQPIFMYNYSEERSFGSYSYIKIPKIISYHFFSFYYILYMSLGIFLCEKFRDTV